MLAEHFGGANGERRIEKHRSGRDITALHQVDQVDDQFLRSLDCEGGDQQRTAGRVRGAHFGGKLLAPGFTRCRRPVGLAVGRFANDVIEPARPLGIRLQQLGVRADVAGGEQAQRGPPSPCPANSISIEAEPSRWPAFQ